ncbi:hypothetical protein, partial [Fluviicola sp.]|uniref:hypothetical protein n=1 Tax=Fluviicola sp. TaxID=1917219 RepID=UPI002621143E
EDLLDAQMSVMTKLEVDDYVKKCDIYLKLFGKKLDSYSILEIPFSEFEDLFLEATGKHLNGRYITAIKIFMGSQEGVGVFPIFQPVYLKRTRYDTITQKELYQIPTYGHGKFYKFVEEKPAGEKFVKMEEGDRDKIIENYTNGSMTMVHGKDQPHTKFIHDIDVEACLFPFQTLFKLIQEKDPKVEKEAIFLTNAIRTVIVDNVYENKHVFIISGEKIENKELDLPAKFANRSHLCPPCNTVDFGFDVFALPKSVAVPV